MPHQATPGSEQTTLRHTMSKVHYREREVCVVVYRIGVVDTTPFRDALSEMYSFTWRFGLES